MLIDILLPSICIPETSQRIWSCSCWTLRSWKIISVYILINIKKLNLRHNISKKSQFFYFSNKLRINYLSSFNHLANVRHYGYGPTFLTIFEFSFRCPPGHCHRISTPGVWRCVVPIKLLRELYLWSKRSYAIFLLYSIYNTQPGNKLIDSWKCKFCLIHARRLLYNLCLIRISAVYWMSVRVQL